MSAHIGVAQVSDHAAIATVLVRAYSGSGMASDHPYFARLRDIASRADQAEVWAAVEHGRVLGTVTWCPEGSPWREIGQPGEGEFRMLAVDPGEQGHGVGAALVHACIERARADGQHAVVLSSAGWMTAAHHLYEKLGFVRTPALDWSPTPGVSLMTYRLELCDAAA